MPEEEMKPAEKPAVAPAPSTPVGKDMDPKLLAAGAYVLGMIISIVFSPFGLGILGILGPFITYYLGKDSKLVRFHSIQSILFGIALSVLMLILVFTIIGILLVFPLALVAFVYFLYLAYKAYQGEFIEAPFIGKISMKNAEKSFIQ